MGPGSLLSGFFVMLGFAVLWAGTALGIYAVCVAGGVMIVPSGVALIVFQKIDKRQ